LPNGSYQSLSDKYGVRVKLLEGLTVLDQSLHCLVGFVSEVKRLNLYMKRGEKAHAHYPNPDLILSLPARQSRFPELFLESPAFAE
jgi:hypothetical protein